MVYVAPGKKQQKGNEKGTRLKVVNQQVGFFTRWVSRFFILGSRHPTVCLRKVSHTHNEEYKVTDKVTLEEIAQSGDV